MTQQTMPLTSVKTTSIITGKRRYVLVLMFCMFMINYMDRINLSVAAPAVAKEFHWDPAQMGWLFSAFLWTYILFLIPCGRWVDRLGTRLMSAFAISLWSLSAMATGAVTTFGTMVAARLGLGMGEASSIPVCGKIVRLWFPAKERGVATTIIHGGSYCGPAVMSPVVAWLVISFGWRWSFVISGSLGFIWLLFWLKFFRVPEETSWLPQEERRFIIETRDGGTAPAPSAGADSSQAGVGALLGKLLRQKTMWGLILAQGGANYSNYMFLSWLPSYLIQARGMHQMKAGFWSGIPYIVAVILSIAFGKLSDLSLSSEGVKQGKRRNMVGLFLLLSSVVLLINTVNSEVAIITIISLALSFNMTVLGINVALTNDLVEDPRIAGTVFGTLITGSNIMGMLAPIVTGYMVKATGSFATAFVLNGSLVIVGGLAAFILSRKQLQGPAGLTVKMAAARP